MRPGAPRPAAQPNAALNVQMAGAVDLAAVKARSEAAARAAESPAPAVGQYVVDVTEESFQSEVLDRSFQLPVLLDVWSARSPASEQLNAALELLAREAAGTYILAKIDVDANMRIAQALQVQGVPAVFAVIGGQLVPGFEGALPEPQLREFISAVLKAATEAGLPGGAAADASGAEDAEGAPEVPEAPEDPRFDAAEAALAEGDYTLAAERFQAILNVEPANAQAALALKQVALMGRIEATAPDLAARADSAPDDVAAQLAAADLAFVADDAAAALRRLLDLLARTAGEERDSVRERLVEFFDLLGPDDERVPPARREMARALF